MITQINKSTALKQTKNSDYADK
ncbi:23S rRNA methyltransferase attenuation leader peptide [Firmicutes bacterium AF36-3BH]|nr:23S rRNA methyltransferase attenuation leader peptide [Firmicutes bacterium AF36-3BH]